MAYRYPMTTSQWMRLAVAGLALGVCAASAQTVFRTVSPDGRVTYSDQPPAPHLAVQTQSQLGARANRPTEVPLPYALQQVASRFPVTLYTGSGCAPCDSARQLLQARGVPFAERTVQTQEDIEALKRLSGDASLPFGSIGGQQLKGFSDLEWTQFLDAAGYPKTSQLPPHYRAAPPTPLVVLRPADATPAPARPAAGASAPAPAAAPVANTGEPAGIRF